jgi:tungstate transport system substrate-binding protein
MRTRCLSRFRFAVSAMLALVTLAILVHPTPLGSQTSRVRIALVNVPDEVLRPLLPEFEKQAGIRGEIVYTGNDPYGVARKGEADLVISHFGHEGVEPFITAGLGLWPHPVFANQMALIGPPADPAHVRGLSDAAEAFRRISATKSLFVVNASAGAKYVEDILWAGAGAPARSDWYLDPKLEGQQAVRAAAEKGAYVLWGVPPFLRLKRQGPLNLEPLVVGDPLFQRIMVSVVVNPAKIPGVNADGAKTLERFLLAPATQARVRAFRYPDFDQQVWWPAGRHNSAAE